VSEKAGERVNGAKIQNPKSKMQIVMIGPFGLRPRMTMRVRALPLAQALTARGHTVTMLLPPWQNPEDAGKIWEEDGVRIENVLLPAGIPGWFHARLTTTLVGRARALRPDVIHVFKPKAYAGLAHLALARRFPVVVDTDDWEGPGGWNDLNPYPPGLKRFFAWQERWGLTHADAVTVASRALQTLTWAGGDSPERVFYVPNGVAWPYPPVTPAPHPRPTLLLYTRFFEFELERLWRVVSAVRTQRPDVRLWFIGQGLFGEEQQLKARAQEAGWRIAEMASPSASVPSEADLIYCAGWIAPEDQPAYFAQADVALYPFDDTLLNRTKCPVKLLDLLAAGVPVVADSVGQIAEVIRSGETGVLVPPGDEAACVAALLGLLDHVEYGRTLGARATVDVRARFAWDALAQVVEQAYCYATCEQPR